MTAGRELAAVLLTQGTRPEALARAIGSVRAQHGVDPEVVVVINGGDAAAVPAGLADRLVPLPQNVGIPAGRNEGLAATDAEFVLFLDDDAELIDPSALSAAVARFRADPRLAVVALRLVDQDGHTARRHVPRVGSRSADESGPVTAFLGGANVMRAAAFTAVGGFDGRFFYAMEETELAWRLLDAGWSIWYAADLRVFHPATTPSRHAGYAQMTARNRAWAAWRLLPAPVMIGYLFDWTLATVVRRGPVRAMVAGYREAWRDRPERRPMRWRTVARLTRLGRPPIV